uniref:LIM zinc-binding domain-containing protein n=1 Tax=Sus scrofa TaxID=9823 RepID=A0A8D0XK30_PIG
MPRPPPSGSREQTGLVTYGPMSPAPWAPGSVCALLPGASLPHPRPWHRPVPGAASSPLAQTQLSLDAEPIVLRAAIRVPGVERPAPVPGVRLPGRPPPGQPRRPAWAAASPGTGPAPRMQPGGAGGLCCPAAERVTSLGKDWHRPCLKCEKCGKTLTSGGHAEHEGKPYCNHPCYAAMFGPKGFGRGGAESHTFK